MQAEKCRAAGQELEAKLKAWKMEIKDFRTAVMATRGGRSSDVSSSIKE
jgi:hypothetical protein